MRFRPANIRLINRRSNLFWLLLALSSINGKSNDNNKNNPTDSQELTGSLHIRAVARAGQPSARGPDGMIARIRQRCLPAALQARAISLSM
jgi:hypothetical protein